MTLVAHRRRRYGMNDIPTLPTRFGIVSANQPIVQQTRSWSIFMVMDIGNKTGDQNLFNIGKRLCTNDETKGKKLENIFVTIWRIFLLVYTHLFQPKITLAYFCQILLSLHHSHRHLLSLHLLLVVPLQAQGKMAIVKLMGWFISDRIWYWRWNILRERSNIARTKRIISKRGIWKHRRKEFGGSAARSSCIF